jgi:hypothetical protein
VIKKIRLYLFLCLSFLFSFCSKQSTPEEEISETTWTISYFMDQQDRTADYRSFYFMFNQDGSLMAHQGQKLTIGRWSQSGSIFQIYFQSNDLLLALNKDWQIVEKTGTIIKLKSANQELHFARG